MKNILPKLEMVLGRGQSLRSWTCREPKGHSRKCAKAVCDVGVRMFGERSEGRPAPPGSPRQGSRRSKRPSSGLFFFPQRTQGNKIKNPKNSMVSRCWLILKGEIKTISKREKG